MDEFESTEEELELAEEELEWLLEQESRQDGHKDSLYW